MAIGAVSSFAATAPALAAAPPAAASMSSSGRGRQAWADFKRRFVTADGRVIDTGNGGVTHTEGQGLAMLFAVTFDDQPMFDRLLSWTATHLRRPQDALHVWRWVPDVVVNRPDLNNATDGDIFIAAAMARAARRWGRPDQAMAAATIARDVLRLLMVETRGRVLLLPGAYGFQSPTHVTVNLSYYAYPFLAELRALAPSPLWNRCVADGLALSAQARFGTWQLPPDWLMVSREDGALAPASGWPARFSYDAIRVPLWLSWSDAGAHEAIARYLAFWDHHSPQPPAWLDLRTGQEANYPAPAGMHAIARLARSGRGLDPQSLPPVLTAPDYYSAALILLVHMAAGEETAEAGLT